MKLTSNAYLQHLYSAPFKPLLFLIDLSHPAWFSTSFLFVGRRKGGLMIGFYLVLFTVLHHFKALPFGPESKASKTPTRGFVEICFWKEDIRSGVGLSGVHIDLRNTTSTYVGPLDTYVKERCIQKVLTTSLQDQSMPHQPPAMHSTCWTGRHIRDRPIGSESSYSVARYRLLTSASTHAVAIAMNLFVYNSTGLPTWKDSFWRCPAKSGPWLFGWGSADGILNLTALLENIVVPLFCLYVWKDCAP